MYYLQIEYGDRLISIPFGKLKDADKYTIQYKNREEFLSNLFKILDLNVSINDIGKIYLVSQDKVNEEFDYELCLPVRYGKDNYNIDSLVNAFVEYLQENHERIRMFDIVHVKLPSMMEFKDGKNDISNEEIRLAVRTYLRDDYARQRETYFAICNERTIKIDRIPDEKKVVVRENLDKLESREDDYLQYIIELAGRDEKGFQRAMEELSLMDMEEISRRLPKTYRGVLDGVSDETMINPQDVLELEVLTGMSIDDLRRTASCSLGRKR